MLPYARSGSKPARIAEREKQIHGRAEFFALPLCIAIANFENAPEAVRPIAILGCNYIAIRGEQEPDTIGSPRSATKNAPAGECTRAAVWIGAPLPNVSSDIEKAVTTRRITAYW